MKITSDWHIHTRNSCDAACMKVADLVREAKELSIGDFGITDHVHTPYNLPDITRSRQEYLAIAPLSRFHFGVEVSCVSQWELDEIASGKHSDPVYGLRSGGPRGCDLAIGITAEHVAEYGIEYEGEEYAGNPWEKYAGEYGRFNTRVIPFLSRKLISK